MVVFVLGYHENPRDDKFDPPGSQTINKRGVTYRITAERKGPGNQVSLTVDGQPVTGTVVVPRDGSAPHGRAAAWDGSAAREGSAPQGGAAVVDVRARIG